MAAGGGGLLLMLGSDWAWWDMQTMAGCRGRKSGVATNMSDLHALSLGEIGGITAVLPLPQPHVINLIKIKTTAFCPNNPSF